ncbi:MAG: MBL fold metallo-hydrolase [Planctomycetota bacterium]|jgi:glyoxylase-like metal-dependent hydrolase (beta-lactamase superfamily II)
MEKKIIATIVAVLSVLFFINSFAQEREDPPVELKQISERLYEVIGGRGARGGAYVGDNGVLIIDAKMDKESVEQVIEEVGKITDKPIKYLVNTHSDGDHIRGNQYFPETVTIIAHENCRKEFFHPRRDGSESEWNNPELSAFVPSLTFKNKMDVYLGIKKVELWYFGVGHTTGDIVVYFPEEKAAFLGDQIFLGRAQLIHSYKGGNSFEHVVTVSKMLETLDVEKFYSGHSEMISPKEIREHLGKMRLLQAKVKVLVEDGKTIEEVKSEFDESEERLVESIYNEIKDSGH